MEDKTTKTIKKLKETLGLLQKGSLHYAVYEHDLGAIKNLIENGSNIEEVDDSGETPLALAANFRSSSIVSYLIENGANVNAKNEFGQTPLMHACLGGDLELVKYLIENGADITIQSDEGFTCLAYAKRGTRLPVIEYLESLGIKPSSADDRQEEIDEDLKNQIDSLERELQNLGMF